MLAHPAWIGEVFHCNPAVVEHSNANFEIQGFEIEYYCMSVYMCRRISYNI